MRQWQTHRIKLLISSAYLLKSEAGAILVDTGSPGEEQKMLNHMERFGVQPNEIRLIVITHAHADHAGNAVALQKRCDAPIALHPDDAAMAKNGRNDYLNATSPIASFVRLFADRPFEPFEPNILLDEQTNLSAYGLDARILHTPGHTPGSISLILPQGDAFAGDLLVGGYLGGVFASHRPGFPFFADSLRQIPPSVRKLLDQQPSKLYLGHGGPLTPTNFEAWLKRVE